MFVSTRLRKESARLIAALSAAACLQSLALPTIADVTVSAPEGFVVEQVRVVAATPEEAYRTFVEDVALWYDGAHTYGGDARALSIDAVPGGCFCERYEGGAVRHMEVVLAMPGRVLRMTGGLGPLQGLAVAGAFTLTFEASEAGQTTARLVYRVGGYEPRGLDGWAGPVDGVLGIQMDRFQTLLAERR